jgi:hypothetical protein
MIGGTEEDAQLAEELLKALPQAERYNARIPQALSSDNPKYREAILARISHTKLKKAVASWHNSFA